MGVNMKKTCIALLFVLATCVGCGSGGVSITDEEHQQHIHNRLEYEETNRANRAAIQRHNATQQALMRQGL